MYRFCLCSPASWLLSAPRTVFVCHKCNLDQFQDIHDVLTSKSTIKLLLRKEGLILLSIPSRSVYSTCTFEFNLHRTRVCQQASSASKRSSEYQGYAAIRCKFRAPEQLRLWLPRTRRNKCKEYLFATHKHRNVQHQCHLGRRQEKHAHQCTLRQSL